MIRFGNPPYLECSSKGDRRFSAFYARINGRSIEETYQSCKIFVDEVFTDWRLAKGKKCSNQEYVRKLYGELWDRYISEHPELLAVLKSASGLSDIFGQPGHACQAEELWRIRQESA